MPERPPYRVAIIGAGFGGIGMALALERAGITDYLVLDRAGSVGGTWRDNTYPGLACDVPSNLYSYSFRPGRWSRRFPPRQEILGYLRALAAERGLGPRLRFGVGVAAAEFDERRALWNLTLSDGGTLQAAAVVSAVGQLNRPAMPDIAGREDFAGPSWHSARWDHDADLTGRRVAVVGTGASAIQFVPEVARTAAHVDVYQRSAPYVLPKSDHPYSPGRAGPVRPVPGGAQGRPAAHLPLRRAAHQRFRLVAQAARCADSDVAAPAPGDHRPGAARQVRTGLRDGLQAGAVLQRLVSGAGPPERRARHRPDRAHRGRRRHYGRRHHPPGGRHHLRHRVQDARLPGAHGGDRPARAAAERDLARRGRGVPGDHRLGVPQFLHALRAQHQPGRQLDHLHARRPDQVRAGGAASAWRGGPRLARRASRGAAAVHRLGDRGQPYLGVGERVPQLVHDRVGPQHQQLARADLPLPVPRQPLRPGQLPAHAESPAHARRAAPRERPSPGAGVLAGRGFGSSAAGSSTPASPGTCSGAASTRSCGPLRCRAGQPLPRAC